MLSKPYTPKRESEGEERERGLPFSSFRLKQAKVRKVWEGKGITNLKYSCRALRVLGKTRTAGNGNGSVSTGGPRLSVFSVAWKPGGSFQKAGLR